MQAKHLALVRALPKALLPALRARALDPHTTKNTRPFGKNPSGGHLYIGRRIRSTDGKRKWEIYGSPAEVLEILDFLEGERKEADSEPSTAIADSVIFIPPPQPPASVTVPVKVVVLPPSEPGEPFDQVKRPLTNAWAVAMMLLVLAPCLLYLTITLSGVTDTSGHPAMVTSQAQSSGSFDHPYHDQELGEQTAETPLVKTVKDNEGVESNKEPVSNATSHRGDIRPSDRLANIGRHIQSLEEQGIHSHRLGLLFDAVQASAGVQCRHLEFRDEVPLTDGQIVEATGEKLFDQLGQMPTVLPKPLKQVWVAAGQSAVASELRDALRSGVTAVAYQADLLGGQLVLRSQSLRLADSFRAAYGVPADVDTWRDPGSGWIFNVMGTCVVIRE